MVKTATTLQEAYNNLDPNEPLPGEDHPFYVQRPEEFGFGTLLQALLNAGPRDKFLFSGPRGSGKSTELRRLSAHIDLHQRFIPVYLTIETDLDLGDVDYQDILFLIGVKAMEKTRESPQPLLEWYQDVLREVNREYGTEVSVGGGLPSLIAFQAVLRSSYQIRRTTRSHVERRLSQLIDRFNQMMETVRQKHGRLPLVLVDGLDKVYDVKVAVKMFLEGAAALTALHCPVMYTVPLSLLYDQQLGGVRMAFRSQYQLPSIRICHRDGSPDEEGRRFLEEVLKRRVAEDLLPSESRQALVELSGGVLKHLVSLAGEAVLRAMQQQRTRILPQDVEYAAQQARLSLSPVFTASQRSVLKRIAETHSFENSEEERELAINLHILRYIEAGEEWWDVHPLLKPLLRRWFP